MNNQSSFETCKELILFFFTCEDLKHCLKCLSCTKKGTKIILQERLMDKLHAKETRKIAIKSILERGRNMNYYSSSMPKNSLRRDNQVGNDDSESEIDIPTKKLYFHKNVKNLSGWKVISSRDRSGLTLFNFKLPTKVRSSIANSKNSEPSKKCLMLRCIEITEKKNLPFNDCYPIGMKMFINTLEYTDLLPREIFYSNLDPKYRLNSPTNLNKAILKLSNTGKLEDYLQMKICFDRSVNIGRTFAFAVFSSTIKTVKELLIETTNKDRRTVEEFKDDLEEHFSGKKEIMVESIKVSLNSSITFEKIKIPFWGRKCNHIFPEDLETYLKINETTELWLCKHCKSPCTPDDIEVDEFFTKVLQNHPNIEEIELFPGAKYKIAGCKEKLSIDNSEIIKSGRKSCNKIVVIKSDDEGDDLFILSPSSNKSNNGGNNGKQLPVTLNSNNNITKCVVLDDSSDEEPLIKVPRRRVISTSSSGTSVRNSRTTQSRKTLRSVDTNNSDETVSSKSFLSLHRQSNDSEILASLESINSSLSLPENESTPFFSKNSVFQQTSVDLFKDRIAKNCPIFTEVVKKLVINSNFYEMFKSSKPEVFKVWKPIDISDELWEILTMPEVISLISKK